MSIDAGYIADNRRFSVAAGEIVHATRVRSDSGRPAQARALGHLDSQGDRLDPGRGLERAPREPVACMEACGISWQRLRCEKCSRGPEEKRRAKWARLTCDDSQCLNEGWCCSRSSRKKKTNCHGESLTVVCYLEPWFAAKSIQGSSCSVSRWAKWILESWCSACHWAMSSLG
jgi:hypothetical protein